MLKDLSYLEDLFDAADIGVVLRDGRGKIISYNRAAEEILTLEILALEAESDHDMETWNSPFIDRDGKRLELGEHPPFMALEKGVIVKDRVMKYEKDEKSVWINVTSIPRFSDDKKKPVSVFSLFSDVTDQIKAKIEADDSKAFLQLVLDNIPQFVFWKDRDLVYRGCNANFATAAGVDSSSCIEGKSDYDLAWEDSQADSFRVYDKQVMDEGKAVYHILEPQHQADGKKAWLDTNKIPLKNRKNEIVGILGTFEDITERIQNEKEMNRLRNYLSGIINSMPSALIGLDRERKITLWNNEAARLSGVDEDRALGSSLDDSFPRMAFLNEKLDGVLAGEGTRKIKIGEGKKSIHEEITIFPLLSGTQQHGTVIRIDDVTEQEKLKDQLLQSQKMDAIGQLSSGMAHDFNNILNGIFGAADILKMSADLDERNSRYLKMIKEAAERAGGLISNLLNFSRTGTGIYTAVDIHKVIHDSLALLENTIDKGICLSRELDSPNSIVMGDASQLQTLILNLAINASHAMPEGGKIEIATSRKDLSQLDCEKSPFDLQPGSHIHIRVNDNGTGMPQEVKDRVFEPFFTTKEQGQGTGLGLSAAYGLIKQLKGSITVYSEPGMGSSFNIYLPLIHRDVKTEAVKESKPVQGRGTILLIDDEVMIRDITGSQLEMLGYKVITAENGQEGVELYTRFADEIDLVIMDMIMPVMNGFDCFLALRDLKDDLPIVAASGFSNHGELERLMSLNLNGFIQKPFQIIELSTIIASNIRKD